MQYNKLNITHNYSRLPVSVPIVGYIRAQPPHNRDPRSPGVKQLFIVCTSSQLGPSFTDRLPQGSSCTSNIECSNYANTGIGPSRNIRIRVQHLEFLTNAESLEF